MRARSSQKRSVRARPQQHVLVSNMRGKHNVSSVYTGIITTPIVTSKPPTSKPSEPMSKPVNKPTKAPNEIRKIEEEKRKQVRIAQERDRVRREMMERKRLEKVKREQERKRQMEHDEILRIQKSRSEYTLESKVEDSSKNITPIVTSIIPPSTTSIVKERPLYGEPQRGDLCRMHSLNAYYGRAKFNSSSFHELCDQFDKKNNLPKGMSRRDFYMDEGYTLTSFIIESFNEFGDQCIVSPRYRAKYRPVISEEWLLKHGITSGFMFTDGHIWAWRYHNGSWYEIDSMRGGGKPMRGNVSRFNSHGHGIILCYPWHSTTIPKLDLE